MYVIRLGIDGMMCGQCEAHVKEKLQTVKDALIIKPSHYRKSAEILSPRSIPEEEFLKALEGSGYRLMSYAVEQREKEPLLYRLKNRK